MSLWSMTREGTINLRDLQGEFDRLVDRLWHGGINTAPLDGQDWAPALEIVDESDRFVITAEVPGLTADKIDVAVVDSAVKLSGTKAPATTSSEGRRTLRTERRFGSFLRTVELPEPVDETRVQASCAHGVLSVSLPKKVIVQGRKIPVEPAE